METIRRRVVMETVRRRAFMNSGGNVPTVDVLHSDMVGVYGAQFTSYDANTRVVGLTGATSFAIMDNIWYSKVGDSNYFPAAGGINPYDTNKHNVFIGFGKNSITQYTQTTFGAGTTASGFVLERIVLPDLTPYLYNGSTSAYPKFSGFGSSVNVAVVDFLSSVPQFVWQTNAKWENIELVRVPVGAKAAYLAAENFLCPAEKIIEVNFNPVESSTPLTVNIQHPSAFGGEYTGIGTSDSIDIITTPASKAVINGTEYTNDGEDTHFAAAGGGVIPGVSGNVVVWKYVAANSVASSNYTNRGGGGSYKQVRYILPDMSRYGLLATGATPEFSYENFADGCYIDFLASTPQFVFDNVGTKDISKATVRVPVGAKAAYLAATNFAFTESQVQEVNFNYVNVE